MACAKLQEYLDQQDVKYVSIKHSPAFCFWFPKPTGGYLMSAVNSRCTAFPANSSGPWRIKEYSEYRRVTCPTVYNWMAKGWLDSVKIGGCRFILPEHDADFIARFNSVGV
jgi:hypothetical protein